MEASEGETEAKRNRPNLTMDDVLDRRGFDALRKRLTELPPEDRQQLQLEIERLSERIEHEGAGGLTGFEKMLNGASTLAVGMALVAWAVGGPLLGLHGALGTHAAVVASPSEKTGTVRKRLKRLAKEVSESGRTTSR